MKNFFKAIFAGFIGTLLAIFLTLVIVIAIVTSMLKSGEDQTTVKDTAVLYLNLNQPLSDRGGVKPDFVNLSFDKKMSMRDITNALKLAEKDDKIKGVFIEPTIFAGGGFANIEELRTSLKNFKKSGKFVVSFSEAYSQKTYYLSSVADSIFLNPAGLVEFTGLSAQIMYYKAMLEKFGVEPVVIRHGKFKSAVEPFLQNYMSDANREQTSKFLNSFWGTMLEGIKQERNIDIKQLNKYADSLMITSAEICKKVNFVDGLLYRDQAIKTLNKLSKVEGDEDVQLVEVEEYMNASQNKAKANVKKDADKIAIIYAGGEIKSGKSDEKTIGSESLSEEIKKAREDSTVKAVVLRVNSPGGSALASEVIWRETVLTKNTKPFIVSMGNMAASGGYYISSFADVIVAQPNTITGSIGVFGLMFNGAELMTKLGLNVETVKTNSFSDIGSPMRKMSKFEVDNIQKGVNEIYEVFIKRVADGRGMTTEQVDKIGQGRVWSGKDAKEIGLVDVLGGLDTALKIAKEKAKLDDYELVEYPEKSKLRTMLEDFSIDAKAEALKAQTGFMYQYVERLKNIDDMKGVQTRMPYFIDIN